VRATSLAESQPKARHIHMSSRVAQLYRAADRNQPMFQIGKADPKISNFSGVRRSLLGVVLRPLPTNPSSQWHTGDGTNDWSQQIDPQVVNLERDECWPE